jgi:hypothetical protein
MQYRIVKVAEGRFFSYGTPHSRQVASALYGNYKVNEHALSCIHCHFPKEEISIFCSHKWKGVFQAIDLILFIKSLGLEHKSQHLSIYYSSLSMQALTE